MRVRKLADIPNKVGYAFYGVDFDDRTFLCEVALNDLGCHYVRNAYTKEPCFNLLAGWLPV